MSAASRRAAASRCVRAFPARSSEFTSPTAKSSGRASCSSPWIRGLIVASLAEARAGVATAQSRTVAGRAEPRPRPAPARGGRRFAGQCRSITAQVQTARAALAAAQARVQQRALDVEFTRIRAPISGRISDRKIDAGNLVSAGVDGGTLLTTINALDPIYFTFDVPESLYLKDARQRREGAAGDVAEIRLQDEASYNWRGTLDFTDNGISQNSGTVRARAVVRNPDLVPDTGHVRQHAPRRRRDDACTARPGRGDPHRPGTQDRADGRQGRHRCSQAGRDRTARRQSARHPFRTDPRRPGRRPGRPVRHARRQGEAARRLRSVPPKPPPPRLRRPPPQAPHRRPWPPDNRGEPRCNSATSSSGARSLPASSRSSSRSSVRSPISACRSRNFRTSSRRR